jgi:tetratricopeptide (TPR) repeat protein
MTDNSAKPASDRLTMLQEFLQQNPGDAFARYGLAMEYSRLGQNDTALEQFRKLLELHPDYTNGYFMAAQTLERAGRTADARKMLENGIEAAKRTGNKHALSEMSGMLDELAS